MKIENDSYVGVIDVFRVVNRHSALRFRYDHAEGAVSDPADCGLSWNAASDLVDYYLNKFTEQDERRKAVLGLKGPW